MNSPLSDMATPLGDAASSSSFHSLLAIGFSLGMLIYWTASFVVLYHLIRFGVGSQPKKIAIVFLVGSLFLSIIASLFLAQILL